MESKVASVNLPQNTTAVKPAAIWARVSTQDQRETSIPSQIDRCKAELERTGYTLTHTLQTDWTSLDLFSCPEFQELRSLIQSKDIEALAFFDRDRLEAQGLQRLVFLSECKQAGVKLIIHQGPPILDEPEGQLVELALAIGKERSVLRARQGSKDGLHDRALKRRLPTSKHKLYGYRWEGERRLVPDDNWPTLKLIFDMLLEGASYYPIIQELKKRGILSPQGQPEWNKAAISQIVHNPTYTGRYYALKKQAVVPTKRNGNTYGNSSQKKLPLDEAHYIPEIEIVDPPITWEQQLKILDQLATHQRLSQRNAKRDYLFRGMIFCETHRGKRGEPRIYHGRPRANSYCYVCPVGGCQRPYFNGPELEEDIKHGIRSLLLSQPDEFYKLISNRQNRDELEKSLRDELHTLELKYDRSINTETKLEERLLSNQVLPEIYERLRAKYHVERKWIEGRKREIYDELAQLGHETEAVASFFEIKLKYWERLTEGLDQLSHAEWKELLATLNFSIHVRSGYNFKFDKLTQAHLNLIRAIFGIFGPYAEVQKDKIHYEDFWCEIGLPLSPAKVKDIVLHDPEPG